MRYAGITTVGEFHYLHHDGDRDCAFDDAVLEAAAEVGIRLVLLQTSYTTGGSGGRWSRASIASIPSTLDGYWRQVDRLARQLDPRTQTLGVVAHSIRASRLSEIQAIHAEAVRRRLPFHIHVEEQRKEIEEAMAAYGRTPMRVLCEDCRARRGSPRSTAPTPHPRT